MTRITRRGFGGLVAGAAAERVIKPPAVSAASPDFTVAIVPDPQFLAGSCNAGAYYATLMNWIVAHRNLTLSSSGAPFAANIKAVLGVGDCVNSGLGSTQTAELSVATSAWSLLDANGIPWVTPPGNHDYEQGEPRYRNYNPAFSAGGFFASGPRSAVYGSGLNIGGSDRAYWYGSYDATGSCTAVKLIISGVQMLIIAMDFFAGTAQWAWAAAIAAANPTFEVYITTHAWLTMYGAQFSRTNLNGPNGYGMADAPYSNSSVEAWSTIGLQSWSNLFGIFGGHDINPPGNAGAWYWQQTPVASTSLRGQTVQQLFMNSQELDLGCAGTANRTTGAGELASLFLLSRRPAAGLLEGRMLSTLTGDWIGTDQWYASETLLFSVPFAGLETYYALPG